VLYVEKWVTNLEVNILENEMKTISSLFDDLVFPGCSDRTNIYDIYYRLSKRIRNYRKSKGYSQKKLAGILECGQSAVSKLESGEYIPTVEQLWKISNKMGLCLQN
jgi:DNA-binding XRE family transcriptional regulator